MFHKQLSMEKQREGRLIAEACPSLLLIKIALLKHHFCHLYCASTLLALRMLSKISLLFLYNVSFHWIQSKAK